MQIKTLQVGEIGANCYCVYSDDLQGIVIDPGAESNKIIAMVKELGISVKYIVLTHGHLDHISAVEELRKYSGAKVLIHAQDASCLTDSKLNLSFYFGQPIQGEAADDVLAEGDQISFGQEKLSVLHTPGHTQGGICLAGPGVVFTGDTLFAGSVGRTDFPGGSMDDLIESIKQKLLTLAPETIVYPGHGPVSTIGQEMQSNPYL